METFRKFIAALSIFCACVLVPDAFAKGKGGGAGDAGGGSLTLASADEIKQTITRLTNNLEWVFVSIYPSSEYESRTAGKPLEDILYKLISEANVPGRSRELSGLGPLPKVQFNETGPCPSMNGDEDASAPLCDHEAPICFSIPRIQAHIPRASLEASLRALLMHERAHQYCADEPLAKKVEDFFAARSRQDAYLLSAVRSVYDQITDNLDWLIVFLKRHELAESDRRICDAVGGLEASALAFRNVLTATSFYGPLHTPTNEDPLSNLLGTVHAMHAFCGHMAWVVENGPLTGDRKSLEDLLDRVLDLADKAADTVEARIALYLPHVDRQEIYYAKPTGKR